MAATTLPSTTMARMSVAFASLTYSWTRMLASSWRRALMTDSAAFFVSARTTPIPWVPSRSLTTTGGPPTISRSSAMSWVEWAYPVTGSPTRARARSCRRVELVPRTRDRLGGVQRVDAHHLELTDHGGSVEGVCRSDAGDDGVESDLVALVENSGLRRRDVHGASEVVDDLDLVAPGGCRLDEAAGRVQGLVAREDPDAHRYLFSPSSPICSRPWPRT